MRLEGYCAKLRKKNIFYKHCQNKNKQTCEAVIVDPSNVALRIDHFFSCSFSTVALN